MAIKVTALLTPIHRKTAYGVAVLMVTNLMVAGTAQPAQAAEFEPWADLRRDEPVAVTPLEVDTAGFADPSADQVWDAAAAAITPPAAATAMFDLDGDTPSPVPVRQHTEGELADFPVSLTRPAYRPGISQAATSGSATVEIVDRDATEAAGIAGVLVRLTPASKGPARLAVDYSQFADLFGGGWSSRLRIVELPECAATSPETSGCLEVAPVPGENNTDSRVVEASVQLDEPGIDGTQGSRLFAVMAAASSDGSGDYRATDLTPAGSWSAGGNDGAFTYNYPLRVPPAAGPVPSVSLGYSSASHDGRTSGRNSQASWAGDGWGYEPGFVQRSYKPCSLDDGGNTPASTGDLCWDGDGNNITMSLNGTNTTLVRDDSSGSWRAAAGANWRIEQLGSPTSGSAATSERWKVTTPDGTQYFFASEVSTSNSRLTVPVFGNHSGEPCRSGAFKDSSCRQAYRWLLDTVVDVHGNMVRYSYTTETGHYGAAADLENRVAYHRAGWLNRIEYGLRADNSGVPATARVRFTTGNRCLSGCGTVSNPTEDNWPDTPWDLHCDAAPCTSQLSPTFFGTQRLTKIITEVHDGSGYRDVDSWSLEHEFKDYGDDEQVTLWLKSIQHTGHVGTDITLPKTQFGGEALPNRVDAIAGVPVMWRWRMSSIKTETGGVITIDYAPTECSPGNLPSTSSNSMRCFPVRWTPEFFTEPIQDWFHKHVVSSVVETDTTGGSVAVERYYDYDTDGGGTSVLWAFDDSEFTEDEHRTYNQWRGYAQVTTRVGDPTQTQTQTRIRYYRGMHGQPLPSGGSRNVSVTDAEGNTVTDHEALAGSVWEFLSYNGSSVIEGSTLEYWTRKTATQTRDHDGGDLEAWLSRSSVEKTRTRLTSAAWQRAETRTSYDTQGRVTQVNSLGDTVSSGDEHCTRTEYADNNTAWIKNAVKRSETVSVACGTTPSRPGDVVSEELMFFDGSNTHGATPSKGLPTRVDTLDDWDGGPVYVTTGRTTYDSLGRVMQTTDALGRATTTGYTPSGPGPLTRLVSTNAAGHETTTELETAWGLPTTDVDPNGRRTDVTYDALGRSSAVWLSGRSMSTQSPTMQFAYLVRDDAPSAVTTKTLNHREEYVTSVVLFDSLLRERQGQTETADRGRLVTETVYDTQGRVEEEFGPNHNTNPPNTTIVRVREDESAARTGYFYDAASRVIAEVFYTLHEERWRTTTSYGGSSDGFLVTVQPPQGAPATATITNARGETIEKRTYRSNTPAGTYDAVTYAYSPTGQMESMTDQAGNQWSWDYDLRGRQVKAVDPDAGSTTMTYDAADQLISTIDARGQTIVNDYDALGRQTTRRDDDGTLLAEWEYDTAWGGIGTLGKATRWVDGNAYINQIHSVNALGLVAHTSVTIPASEGQLAGQYWFTQDYFVNGLVSIQGFDDAGDAEGGLLQWNYDHVGNPTRLVFDGDHTNDAHIIVDEATFTPFNEIKTRSLGAPWDPRRAYQGFAYEEGTRRLKHATFDREASLHAVADIRYTHDDAGNVLSIADVPEDLPANHELQCFRYDAQLRLVEAWAQGDASGCASSPSMAVLGGPAPYWHSYQHDPAGNRTAETLRAPGQPAQSRTYTYPAAGQPHPHAVQQVTTTGTSEQLTFDYDPAGNTTSRDIDGDVQTLQYDAEGRLEAVQEDGEDTVRMVYDADGNRIIRDDGDTVTAFMPQTELTWDRATNTLEGIRYFTHAGQVVAVCAGQDVADWVWMGADHHNTTTHAVNAFTGVEQIRRFDPYGNPRGPRPTVWLGQQAFVGGVEDPTGLVHIGARSYDPNIGRFLSVDPILALGDGQQINGYSYAYNNPITFADPTGLFGVCAPSRDSLCPDQDIRKQPAGRPPPPKREFNPGVNSPCVDYCGSHADNTVRREYGAPPIGMGGQTGPVEPGVQPHTLDGSAIALFGEPYGKLTPQQRAAVREFTFKANNPALAAAIRESQQVPYGENDEYPISDELIGVADGHRCFAKGNLAGCGWLVADVVTTVVPPAKILLLAKLAKLFRFGRAAQTGAKFCSFSGDTEVLMADGTTKPISEIEPGDEVLATNPEAGQQQPQRVTAAWRHDDTIIDLQVLIREKAEPMWTNRQASVVGTVSTTSDHRFWNRADRQWQRAVNLDAGDQLLSTSGSLVIAFGLLDHTLRERPAYNLEVSETHTYYVLAGGTPVLVHNACSDAAYQGALHIQDEVARGNLNHVIPGVDMSDADAIGSYIDGFIGTRGRALVDGGQAWYDYERGVIVIQRNDWSTTAYQATFDYFLRKTN